MQCKPFTVALSPTTSTSAVIAYPDDFTPGTHTAVILAHGAGNDMRSSFVSAMHEGLAQRGLVAVKFNFPYKERGAKAPDPARVLEACYRRVLDHVRNDPEIAPRRLVIGGKSMGGRMASHLAAAGVAVDGLIFLGYPLHPAGKPEQLRVAHLARIKAPMLFFAGTRDALCKLDLLQATIDALRREHAAAITLHVIDGADHSFDVLKSLRRPPEDVRQEIINTCADWLGHLPGAQAQILPSVLSQKYAE
jgi:hypothetical protein